MKRVDILFVCFLLSFAWSFGGKVLRLSDTLNESFFSTKACVVIDFPNTITFEKISYLKKYLGFVNARYFNLNKKKFIPENCKKPLLYFKIYKSGRDKFMKKFLKLPNSSTFSSREIKFGDVDCYGESLSAIFTLPGRRVCFVGNNIDSLVNLYEKCTGLEQNSCYVFNHGNLMKDFVYDNDFSYVNSEIPVYWAIKDLDFFFESLKSVHPALLAYRNLNDYLRLKEYVYKQITIKSRDGYLKIKDFLNILYYGAAFFRDGHLSIFTDYIPSSKNSSECGFPPFLFTYADGFFRVGETADIEASKYAGKRIISINGMPVTGFLKPIIERCSGASHDFIVTRFISRQPFYFSLVKLMAPGEKLTMKLNDKILVKLNSIDVDAYMKLWNGKTKLNNMTKIKVKFYDDGKICYFYLPEFNNSYIFRKKIDRIFHTAIAKDSAALVIDIRGNLGGNSELGEYIASYITKKRIETFSGMEVKLSKGILKYYFPLAPEELAGIVSEVYGIPHYPEKHKNIFKGKVYVLIDHGVFSSACAFAAMVKDFKLGKLIGYETGGRPTSFGDVFPLVLPYSCIEYGVSWKRFYRPRYFPEEANRGVVPDVVLKNNLLKKYKGKDDSFLSFALDFVKKDIEKSNKVRKN